MIYIRHTVLLIFNCENITHSGQYKAGVSILQYLSIHMRLLTDFLEDCRRLI